MGGEILKEEIGLEGYGHFRNSTSRPEVDPVNILGTVGGSMFQRSRFGSEMLHRSIGRSSCSRHEMRDGFQRGSGCSARRRWMRCRWLSLGLTNSVYMPRRESAHGSELKRAIALHLLDRR